MTTVFVLFLEKFSYFLEKPFMFSMLFKVILCYHFWWLLSFEYRSVRHGVLNIFDLVLLS